MEQAGVPLTLSRLSGATQDIERDQAWTEFVAAHSETILRTCRALTRDHDAAMDGYAHVLHALREDGCRRLRAYVPDGTTRFSTWLVVVTRRLVVDHLRRKYGRARSEDQTRRAEQATRRRLEDLVAEQVEPDRIADPAGARPDAAIRRQQLADALRDALEELEPADRLLLALRFEDERPVRDIARALGFPSVFHVYRRLHAVLSQLRRALGRRGVNEPGP